MKHEKDKRFVTVYRQGLDGKAVIVDKETGVNYLFVASGYSGGLCPLLDRDGKPVVTPVTDEID